MNSKLWLVQIRRNYSKLAFKLSRVEAPRKHWTPRDVRDSVKTLLADDGVREFTEQERSEPNVQAVSENHALLRAVALLLFCNSCFSRSVSLQHHVFTLSLKIGGVGWYEAVGPLV